MTILLIDSDKLLANNITAAFARAGHKLVHVGQAETAIEYIDKRPPQLIILDLQLAGRSGVEFLFEFKSYPEWAKIPIIIFSSLSQVEAKRYLDSFSKLDIKNYFYKPATSLGQLVEAANQLVPA
jgi:DNA-binding response OmpR family regulator